MAIGNYAYTTDVRFTVVQSTRGKEKKEESFFPKHTRTFFFFVKYEMEW